jgi:hypothetical protein
MPTIYLYNDMIQLFNTLVVPIPTNVKGICTPSGTNTTYGNWGYAQINAVVLAPGQKYNIIPQNPGYMVLNLGYYTTAVNLYTSPESPNWYYFGFNLNDYNNYVNNSNVKRYLIDSVEWTSLATAYAYVDSNGFVLDLTELPSQYAVLLGLLKFDYVDQFTTYQINTAAGTINYYIYRMSTALNTSFSAKGASSLPINTYTFLGIPVNTSVQPNSINFTIGYQLNYNFLINDEVVSNNAFSYPTDQSNVANIPINTSILVQSNGSLGAPQGTTTLNQFGSTRNITYYSVVGFTSTYNVISATGSNNAPGIPNTNAIADSAIDLPFPNYGQTPYILKSIYNNNGYNDIWIYSQQLGLCIPNNTTQYVFPPYFNLVAVTSSSNFIQFNSSSPDIIYQYIAQAPIVQITTSTTSTVTTSSSTTQTQTVTTPTTQSQTITSSTSSTTVTNITQQIVTALANPIVALILALALVGMALFVLV